MLPAAEQGSYQSLTAFKVAEAVVHRGETATRAKMRPRIFKPQALGYEGRMKPKGVAFKAKIEKFADYATHYIPIPVKVIKTLGGKFRLRLVCTINGLTKQKFRCGLMALGDGRGFVMLSKTRLAALGLANGDPVRVALELDTSKYGMEMPPEFKEVLKQDEEGRRRFESLSAGKKRTLLFYVGGAKNVDLRIERALRFLENLKQLPVGKETIPGIFGKSSKLGSGRW